MTPRAALARKLCHLVVIVLLLVPLYWLGQPAVPPTAEGTGSPGGKLARLREEYNMNQTLLGEIDPTSEALKLATLGLRPLATTILWWKADDYKMRKDWTNLSATLTQITKFQPNFASVWRFQGWNLSYNVSAEFDDYRERYRWVIRGINFLKEGIRHNRQEAILSWDVGWFVSHKIGRSDEQKLYRPMFKADDDFHDKEPPAPSHILLRDPRDNWLVGKKWFLRVEDIVDQGGRMRGTPLIYRSDAPRCQMSYADTIEKEGQFGEVAKEEWRLGGIEFDHYGSVDLPTSEGPTIRLNDLELCHQRIQELVNQIDALAPGLREKILAEKRAALTTEHLRALEIPPEERTGRQYELAAQAEGLLRIDYEELARRVPGPARQKALELARQAAAEQATANLIRSYRDIVNFDYWRLRCQVEQQDATVSAREALYHGDRAFARGDLTAARQYYDRGLSLWRQVLDKYPQLLADTTQITIDDLMDVVKQYRQILDQLDEQLDENTFILRDVINAYKKTRRG